MKIVAHSPYLSIAPFSEMELPSLVVLTGVNGSGKSQFLQAIEQGWILTDIFGPLSSTQPPVTAPNPQVLRLENGGAGVVGLAQQAISRFGQAGQRRAHTMSLPAIEAVWAIYLRGLQEQLADLVANREIIDISVWQDGPEALLSRHQFTTDEAANIEEIFAGADQAIDLKLNQPPGQNPMMSIQIGRISEAARRIGIPRYRVTEALLDEIDSWGTYSAFDPSVSQIMAAYRDEWTNNGLRRLNDEQTGQHTSLTQAEFEKKFGAPPWRQMNEVIHDFGLEYEIEPPQSEISVPVQFVLRRIDNQAQVHFEQLSSGEKVLMRFALSLFPFDPVRIGITRPKLLLLDEMDASLHPEMVKRWLTTIQDGLIGAQGLTCILTTHSPTTVALAPEESLYELIPGVAGPCKVTRQQALNRLTYGVPTLSIDYESRRQVFVESDTDAAAYELLNAQLKGRLALERTITFLSTGVRLGKLETGAGCGIVRKIVSELRAGGSRTVFGLLDWDGKAKPDAHVHVVGQGSHYSLDNMLLDPLLVGALLLKDLDRLSELDLTYVALERLDQTRLQTLADHVQNAIAYPGDDRTSEDSIYLGAPTLKVRTTHRTMNGHELEDQIIQAFPSLKKYSGKGRGKLSEAIVSRVLADYPVFCPKPIADAFIHLASVEPG